MSSVIHVRKLGLRSYREVWQDMQSYTDTRSAESPDQLWLVEHFPVYTQGQAGKPEHLLNPGAIEVVQTDRGGQVTYHGPGQLVAYPLLNLKRRNLGVRDLVSLLEDCILAVLQDWAIPGYIRPKAPGVYVAERKIASLGLRVRRGCSFHGLSLNVAMDLHPFGGINPCGYNGLQMTQMADHSAVDPEMVDVEASLTRHLADRLDVSVLFPDS